MSILAKCSLEINVRFPGYPFCSFYEFEPLHLIEDGDSLGYSNPNRVVQNPPTPIYFEIWSYSF